MAIAENVKASAFSSDPNIALCIVGNGANCIRRHSVARRKQFPLAMISATQTAAGADPKASRFVLIDGGDKSIELAQSLRRTQGIIFHDKQRPQPAIWIL